MHRTATDVPDLPYAIAPLGAYTAGEQRDLIASALADVRKGYARHHNWQQACTAMEFGMTAPDVKRMPGKASKHQMYSDAARVIRLCGWDHGDIHPACLDDLGVLIARVESLLRRP